MLTAAMPGQGDLLALLEPSRVLPHLDPARSIDHSLYCPLGGPCDPRCEEGS